MSSLPDSDWTVECLESHWFGKSDGEAIPGWVAGAIGVRTKTRGTSHELDCVRRRNISSRNLDSIVRVAKRAIAATEAGEVEIHPDRLIKWDGIGTYAFGNH